MFEKLEKHVALVKAMAARSEIDFGDEMILGRLRPQEYRNMVLRCAKCERVEDCEAFLQSADPAKTPAFCLNREAFDRMGDL